MYKLTVTKGPDQGKTIQLVNGRKYVVGANEDASLPLTDPMVLDGHASLEVAGGQVVLQNHTASAGTFVGDKKIKRAGLRPKMTFRVGDTLLTLDVAPKSAATRQPKAPQRPKRTDPLVGKIVAGYKLDEVVGRGGMGTVFKATQLSLHRDVAVKVLSPELAKDKSFRDLFIHEARAAAQLADPNIVQVFDAGIEGEISYFSMEYIGQGSVEELLERDKKIPWEEAILMILEAAHGLDYAEGKGIVHRDIKPDNLMLNDDGRIKIADLGLAKRGETASDQGVIGTPHFIPPEQALGKDVDSRADIYSLGCTFFRMITGRTVFSGKSAKEIVLKHIKEPAPAASSIEKSLPDELDAVLALMLAKEPGQRYQSCKELIGGLELVCAHHGIKGSIIKKGIPKRVLIPVVILLLGAVGVAISLAMRGPVTVENPGEIKARLEAEAKAKAAAERSRLAQREQRKSKAESDYRGLEVDMLRLPNIDDTYDDPATAQTLEGSWNRMAERWQEFADSQDAQEFDWAEKAGSEATRINKRLKNLKEASADKRQHFDAWLKEAKAIDLRLRGSLANLRTARRWGNALRLCDLVGAQEIRPDDPFQKLLANVWVSPLDQTIRVAANKNAKITKAVEETRNFFRKERPVVLRQAQDDWAAIEKSLKALADGSSIQDIWTVIEMLEKVTVLFPDESGPSPDLDEFVKTARKSRTDLEKRITTIRDARRASDRAVVGTTLRRQRSLDPGQIPNLVMNGDIPAAINAWIRRRDDGDIKTERYQAFVAERIRLLRWADYLFRQFHFDVKASIKNKQDPTLVSLSSEIPGERRPHKFKFSKPGEDPYEFALDRKFERNDTLKFGRFPMDWVHGNVFLHQGKPRWKTVTPALRFALGAFCFETMQYQDAAQHFEAVAGDELLGKAATALMARARREAIARKDYETLLNKLALTKTSAETRALTQELAKYSAKHAGTLFHLEVLEGGATIVHDFDEGTVLVADLPTAPRVP